MLPLGRARGAAWEPRSRDDLFPSIRAVARARAHTLATLSDMAQALLDSVTRRSVYDPHAFRDSAAKVPVFGVLDVRTWLWAHVPGGPVVFAMVDSSCTCAGSASAGP